MSFDVCGRTRQWSLAAYSFPNEVINLFAYIMENGDGILLGHFEVHLHEKMLYMYKHDLRIVHYAVLLQYISEVFSLSLSPSHLFLIFSFLALDRNYACK